MKIVNDILKAALIMTIKFYKYVISPMIPSSCRYLPSCSDYALDSLKFHGILRGCMLIMRRILRCHPFGGHGLDPVENPKGNSRV
jgi:putative membrane protein insertion efficiency factor